MAYFGFWYGAKQMNQVWLSLMPLRQNCAVPVLPATSYVLDLGVGGGAALVVDDLPHAVAHFLDLVGLEAEVGRLQRTRGPAATSLPVSGSTTSWPF